MLLEVATTVDSNKLNTLLQFVEMGWALIPLHDVTSGVCSCAAAAECPLGSWGKHPRNKSWQTGGWVRDEATLTSIVRDRPGWNWGAVTGPPSGVWVLDVDPDHGGMESLAELIEVCGTSKWLGAHRVHRTGGGGLHLVYAIGDDGWMPRTGAGRIGPGLDVRAEGGQVVLPSSVSGKGEYVVERDLGVQVVGVMLRAEIERRLAPAERVPREVGLAGEQGAVSEAGDRYASAVVETLLKQMRDAPVGTRNDTGFRTAVRLWELILAPWCSLDEDAVLERWWEAAGITGAPAGELQGLWTRGYGRAVEGEGAVLPASTVGGETVPFAGGPAPGPDTSAMNVVEYRAFVEAGRTADAGPVGMLGRLVWNDALDELRPLRYLVEDTLFLGADSWLIGASGGYKSFVALDWALHVATGKPWAGKRVRQGVVLYIAAEGAHGIAKRRRAWERTNGVTVGSREFAVLPEVVHAAGSGGAVHEEWVELVTSVVRELKPVLVVLDTQSRMTVGMDENSNSDMAFWAECVAMISREVGACALVVHHTGRKGAAARGGSAIDAAQDTEWTVTRPERPGEQRTALLACTKSKDSDDQQRYALELDLVELGEDEEGKPITSLGVRVVVEGVAVEYVERTVGETATGVPMAREVEDRPMCEEERHTLALWNVIYDNANHGNGASWSVILGHFRELPQMKRYAAKTGTNYANKARANLERLGLMLKADRGANLRVVEVPNGKYGRLTPSSSLVGWMPEDGWQLVPHGTGRVPAWARDRVAEYDSE